MWFSLCKSRSSAVQAAYNDRLHLSSSMVSPFLARLNCWMLVYMTKFRQKNFTWASWATGAACATNRGCVNSHLHSLCLRVLAGFVQTLCDLYLDLETCAGTTEGERSEEGSPNSKKTGSGSRSKVSGSSNDWQKAWIATSRVYIKMICSKIDMLTQHVPICIFKIFQ